MKKIKMEPPNKCIFWHRWRLHHSTSVTSYFSCKDCGARFARVINETAGFQPIDYSWVFGLREQPKPYSLTGESKKKEVSDLKGNRQ